VRTKSTVLQSRRSFLNSVAGIAGGAVFSSPVQLRAAELTRSRETVRKRRRRLILDDDGDQVFYINAEAGPEELLATRYGPWLDGMPVDSVAWCQMWGIAWNSTLEKKHGNKELQGEIATNYWRTQRNGVPLTPKIPDPTPVMVDYCRDHDIEIFGSLRMNDTHDAFGQPYRKLDYPLKLKHPEFLLGDENDRPRGSRKLLKNWMWSGLDFAHEKVRDDRFWWINHTASKYNVDGVDLNFFRFPWYFKPGQEERNMPLLTELVRRSRRRLDVISRERRRPVLLGVRIPGTLDTCRKVGIDIEEWLKENLIDRMLIGGGQACSSTPAEELVALGHRHGVPVYPCISCDLPHFANPEVLRGAAAVLWQSGADGLYLWNYHYIRTSNHLRGRPLPTDYQYLAELGDRNRLVKLDKTFVVNPPEYTRENLWSYLRFSAPLPLPVMIKQVPTGIPIRIGDDIAEADTRGRLKSVRLRLEFAGDVRTQKFDLRINGRRVGEARDRSSDGSRIDHTLSASLIRTGENQLDAAINGDSSAKLMQASVIVRYR